MKQFLKQNLKEGKEIIFDNETTFTDDFRSMECSLKKDFQIRFNGAFSTFKTFDAFFKKFEQIKQDWNLQLKSF